MKHYTRHAAGPWLVQIVNSAANFWKHRDEWELQDATDRRRTATIAVLAEIGVDVSGSYPLSNVVAKLGGRRVSDVATVLIPWREVMLQMARARE